MNLAHVDFKSVDTLDPFYSLKTLYDVNGNCPESGYLEEDFTEIGYNDEHFLEFGTRSNRMHMDVKSKGCVLFDSIVIKQKRSMGSISTYHLYSWDIKDHIYSTIDFNNEEALDQYYDGVKDKKMNLCHGDIEEKIEELDLPKGSIMDVAQDQKLDKFKHMMDDYHENKGRAK